MVELGKSIQGGTMTTTTKLVIGAIAVTFCTGDFLWRCFYETSSFMWIPVGAGYMFGLIGFFELESQNNRREAILKRRGIDERNELI